MASAQDNGARGCEGVVLQKEGRTDSGVGIDEYKKNAWNSQYSVIRPRGRNIKIMRLLRWKWDEEKKRRKNVLKLKLGGKSCGVLQHYST